MAARRRISERARPAGQQQAARIGQPIRRLAKFVGPLRWATGDGRREFSLSSCACGRASQSIARARSLGGAASCAARGQRQSGADCATAAAGGLTIDQSINLPPITRSAAAAQDA